MIIKLNGGMAGDRFSFKAGAVIKCSDKTGKRYIEANAAKEMPADTLVDGELFDEVAEERIEKPAGGKGSKGPKETSTAPKPDTPEGAKCQATTNAGNPCARKPAADSTFCAAHQPK